MPPEITVPSPDPAGAMWWFLAGIVCLVILLDGYLSKKYYDDEDRE